MNAQKNLVHVNHGKPFTDSLVIAENCEIEHASIIKLVRQYKEDFEEFGILRFEIAKRKTQGRKTEYAELNEDQATYLITLFRNNDVVRTFKKRLVKEFRKLVNELNRINSEPDRKATITEKRASAHLMTDSLLFVREMMGKKTNPNHYCNEHLFCNRALTGEWKPIDETALDIYDLRLLKAIRDRNTLLIQHYPNQSDRKQLLDDFVIEYRAKYPRLQLVL